MADIVSEVVRKKMDKVKAVGYIKQRAMQDIQPDDRARFIEVVETELMSLHEGNIARYRLRPVEYSEWKVHWT